jgi:hypothetical protein
MAPFSIGFLRAGRMPTPQENSLFVKPKSLFLKMVKDVRFKGFKRTSPSIPNLKSKIQAFD